MRNEKVLQSRRKGTSNIHTPPPTHPQKNKRLTGLIKSCTELPSKTHYLRKDKNDSNMRKNM